MSLYPGQEPPSGLRLWLRFAGDQLAGLLMALGIWPRPQEPPQGR